MISFAARADGTLYSGHELTKILPELEAEGAAAVGVNCIAASDELSALIRKLRLSTQLPLICKPNAGRPANDAYPVDESMFVRIMKDCIREGANLVGGCCGTTPKYLAALKNSIA
jgi:5-methyltetrahydrofolate--homocysteine methyltransferase